MMQNVLNSFSRLCVTNSRFMLNQSLSAKFPTTTLIQLLPQHQQIRFINKHGYLTETGWKAFGFRWIVKFPEKYTVKKLPLMKLAGRDPTTGQSFWMPTKTITSKYKYFYIQVNGLLVGLEVDTRKSIGGQIIVVMDQRKGLLWWKKSWQYSMTLVAVQRLHWWPVGIKLDILLHPLL